MILRKNTGTGHGRTSARDGGRDAARAASAMLNVPTLWIVFVVNFLALGLVWAYVMRSYPKLESARFWTASAFAAAVGGAMATARVLTDTLTPLLFGGT